MLTTAGKKAFNTSNSFSKFSQARFVVNPQEAPHAKVQRLYSFIFPHSAWNVSGKSSC